MTVLKPTSRLDPQAVVDDRDSGPCRLPAIALTPDGPLAPLDCRKVSQRAVDKESGYRPPSDAIAFPSRRCPAAVIKHADAAGIAVFPLPVDQKRIRSAGRQGRPGFIERTGMSPCRRSPCPENSCPNQERTGRCTGTVDGPGYLVNAHPPASDHGGIDQPSRFGLVIF